MAIRAGVEIGAEDKASPAINRFASNFRRSMNLAHRASAGLGGGLASLGRSIFNLKNMVTGFLAVMGARRVWDFTIGNAAEAEAVYDRLKGTVEATGVAWSEAEAPIRKFTAAQQALTRFSEEEVAETLGRLVLLTGDYGKAMEYASLALDISVRSGIGAEEAATLLAKALEGDTMALERLLPELKASSPEMKKLQEGAQRAEYAFALLKERFSGAAAEEDNFTKSSSQLKNQISEIGEALGMMALPYLSEFVKQLTPAVAGMAALAGATGDWTERTAAGAAAVREMAAAMGLSASASSQAEATYWRMVEVLVAVQQAVNFVLQVFNALHAVINILVEGFYRLQATFWDMSQTFVKSIQDTAGALADFWGLVARIKDIPVLGEFLKLPAGAAEQLASVMENIETQMADWGASAAVAGVRARDALTDNQAVMDAILARYEELNSQADALAARAGPAGRRAGARELEAKLEAEYHVDIRLDESIIRQVEEKVGAKLENFQSELYTRIQILLAQALTRQLLQQSPMEWQAQLAFGF